MEDLSKTPTTLSLQEWKKAAVELYAGNYPGVDDKVPFGKAKQYLGVPDFDGDLRTPTSAGGGKVNMKKAATRAEAKKRQAGARTGRISGSKKEVNKAIRAEASAQWDELVGDRNATINIGNRNYTFDQYLNKEVRDHTKLTKQKAVEAVNLGKTLGHGTPTTDVGRYAESYTQQFAETGLGNFEKRDYVPPNQTELLRQAGLPTSPQEAAQMHVGTTKVGGRVSDVEIEKILASNLKNPLAQTAVSSSILQKAQQIQPDLNTLRRTATAAAVGGAALPAFLGSAASASELATRKAIQAQTGSAIDKLQTGIAGASLAADTASYVPVLAVPAGIASAGLDIVNTGIDVSRNLIEEAKKNQLLQNIYNTFR